MACPSGFSNYCETMWVYNKMHVIDNNNSQQEIGTKFGHNQPMTKVSRFSILALITKQTLKRCRINSNK